MRPEAPYIFGIFATFVILEMLRTRFFHKRGQTRDDTVVEVISPAALLLMTQPLILASSAFVASRVAPDAAGSLATLPILAQIGLLLIFDDMVQYWWHRTTHRVKWLYNLHRAHHNAEYLSIRVVYRNNFFYYVLMPSIWFSGVLIYLGLGWVYSFYLVFKLTVIYGAHSDVRWDEPLYKIRWMSPVMWVIERTISTPATHSAHHGRHADDGITNYKGNYGNLLFFWDVLFGTAKITRQYPEEFGVENLEPMGAAEQLFWPVIGSTPGSPAKTPGSTP